MTTLEKAGNFALFINLVITILYILITWDGSGDISFVISDEVPFGSDRVYNVTIFGMVTTIVVIVLAVAGILGVQVFGSGLQDSSVEYMMAVMLRMIIYIVLSIFTYAVLSLMGTAGLIFYWLLTFMYVIGLLESMFFRGSKD